MQYGAIEGVAVGGASERMQFVNFNAITEISCEGIINAHVAVRG